MALTFEDIRIVVFACDASGWPCPKGWALQAADELGLREYSADRGPVPAPALRSGKIDHTASRVLNAYWRGEYDV